MRVRPAPFALVVLSALASPFAIPHAREPSLEERIGAQEAIERLYYSHQIGATRPFEEAVPRSLLEQKVRTYLKQSAALEKFWNTPVTAEMLRAEVERMARQTRMPERLRQLFAVLGDDPFLIQECLGRQILVNRLARNFLAADERINAGARDEAVVLHARLVDGTLKPSVSHPRRFLVHVQGGSGREGVTQGDGVGDAGERHGLDRPSESLLRLEVGPGEFRRWRAGNPDRIGEVGPLIEERDAFVIRVVLSDEPDESLIANYTVRKVSWDEWWARVEDGLDEGEVRRSVPQDDWRSVPPLQPSASPSLCIPDDTWDNGSLDDLQAGRSGHTAIWTGSVMVVWGGVGGLGIGAGDSGGRYDPLTDTWTPTSMIGVPSTRVYHTAVWTGSEMIVWGGLGDGLATDTGGRYDPVHDTWVPTSRIGAPAGRYRHATVWMGSQMVVWGGAAGGSSTALNDGGRYDPVTDVWSPMPQANAPSRRVGPTAVWTGREVIIWGGVVPGFYPPQYPRSGARYDPGTNTWTPTTVTSAPQGRELHSVIWTGARMIVWGGLSDWINLGDGAQYDPISDAWSPVSGVNAPEERNSHTAIWTGDEMVIWGGMVSYSYEFGLDSGAKYDPGSDSWTPTSTVNAPLARGHHTAVWTGTAMIVWGGSSRESTGTITGGFNTGGRYDPATDSWTPTSGLAPPSDRFGYTSVWTGNSMIVWGGSYVNVGDRYDLVTDDWTRISTIQEPDGRVGHSAVWTGTYMIVWGGQTLTEAFLSRTGGRYDPISDTWTPTSTVATPQGRIDATVVWTGEEMIVWGGDDYYHPFATGGRYRAVTDTWAPVSTSNAPTARSGHTAVWTGSRMVVWGGLGDFDWVETGGLYDPASDTWMSTSTTQAPTPRYSHTAVWTGTRMIVWGGSACPDTTCVYFNTGASYDPLGDTWLPTSTVNAPDPRFGHTAVWTGDRMVVWGGGIGGPIAFDTGGRYDPLRDEWSPTSPVNAPRPLIFHHAVWTGSLMIVWGGSGGRYALGHDADNDGDGPSECAGDCNDADSAVHPGAPEICDGLDNDCDAVVDNAPVPGGIPLLTVQPSGSETLLSWSSLSQATGYDVVRGDLSILLGSGGDFAPATQACLADDLGGTFFSVTDAPVTDGGFWYLVRPVNCGGHGSYDSGGPAQVRPRDDGINATASSCP